MTKTAGMIDPSTGSSQTLERRSARPSRMARIVCVVAVSLALGLAGLMASPWGSRACGSCGEGGSRIIALAGTLLLGATLLLLVTAREASILRLAGLVALAATAAGHAGLIAARPGEACTLCIVIFVEVCFALAATALDCAAFLRSRRAKGLGLSTGLLAAAGGAWIGFAHLPGLLESPVRVHMLPLEEVAARFERVPDDSRGGIALHVILRADCPRCRRYWESEHAKVLASLSAADALFVHDGSAPGYLAPGAYPAFLITTGSDELLGSVEGAWHASDVLQAIELVRGARKRKSG